jgi:hypothetical protein
MRPQSEAQVMDDDAELRHCVSPRRHANQIHTLIFHPTGDEQGSEDEPRREKSQIKSPPPAHDLLE